jgi:hypothetical protein
LHASLKGFRVFLNVRYCQVRNHAAQKDSSPSDGEFGAELAHSNTECSLSKTGQTIASCGVMLRNGRIRPKALEDEYA